MGRKLATDEQALWAKVVATVKPLRPRPGAPAEQQRHSSLPTASARPAPARTPVPPLRPGTGGAHGEHQLDGGWEKRLSRGAVQPDAVLDLHGHNLANAHALLDHRIEEAIAAGYRLLLLITGKSPTTDRGGTGRGVIRAAVRDWLAASRHAPQIAAVRSAHPRHGGAGALYIVLRRPRMRA